MKPKFKIGDILESVTDIGDLEARIMILSDPNLEQSPFVEVYVFFDLQAVGMNEAKTIWSVEDLDNFNVVLPS